MKRWLFAAGLIALIDSGCATNHLEKFYVDTTHEAKVPKGLKDVQPDIFSSNNLTNDVTKAMEDGLLIIGYSDYWTSSPPTIQDLKKQAKRVGATTVLWQIHYRGSETTLRPVYNWVPGSTATYNSSGSVTAQTTANVYGNGLYGSAYGNAQGNYYSSATASSPGYIQYAGAIPVKTDFYDVAAVFLRRP